MSQNSPAQHIIFAVAGTPVFPFLADAGWSTAFFLLFGANSVLVAGVDNAALFFVVVVAAVAAVVVTRPVESSSIC